MTDIFNKKSNRLSQLDSRGWCYSLLLLAVMLGMNGTLHLIDLDGERWLPNNKDTAPPPTQAPDPWTLPLPSMPLLAFFAHSQLWWTEYGGIWTFLGDNDLSESISDTLMLNLFCSIFFALKLVNFFNVVVCILSFPVPLTFVKHDLYS